jgi:exodeoxyribonuclease V alpha subunit
VKGGVKFYRGSAAGARAYVEAGRGRVDDYYLGEGTGIAQRFEASAEGVVVALPDLDGGGYEAWVAGVDPVTGEVRGRVRTDERAVRFAEVVVNGPKSWSLAAELHPEIAAGYEAAQDRAVADVVRWMGLHATSRVGPRGAQVSTAVDRVEAVAVRHYTNRAGDPHRHVHVQINARVHAAGEWRGIDTVAVRQSIAAVQGIGHAAVVSDPQFRAVLAEHGFTLDEAGEITQLSGYVAAFSQRAEQIGRQIDGYETQWREANPDEEPGPALRRVWDARAWAEDRPDKGTPEPADQARRRWVDELYRLGYTDPDRAVQVGGGAAASIDRDSAAAEVVARLGTARSAWNHPDIRGQAEQLFARRLIVADPTVRGELVEDVTARAVELCQPLLGRAGVPGHIRALTSAHVVEVEDDITGRLAVRGALGGTDADRAAVSTAAEQAGRVLDERQAAAAAALAGDHGLVLIQGAAGAGKTTTLATARDVLTGQGHAMVVVTPTLKAAKVAATDLGTATGSAAGLAWQHGWRWDDTGWRRLAAGEVDPTTGRVWPGPQPTLPLAAGDLLVVDEAGMLDQDTARALLTIADEHGARLALVGDPHQLPAVGRGGVLDIAARWTSSVTDLTVIHRFTRAADIAPGITGTVPDVEYAALSLAMRYRTDPAAVFDQLVARGQVHYYDTAQDRDTAVAARTVQAYRGGRRDPVVVDTREQATALNAGIRTQLVDAGLVDDRTAATTGAGERIGAGDLVATRLNDRAADVANRDRWTVTAAHSDGGLTVTGPPGERRLAADYVARHVELAYATTAYGVQGDTSTAAHLVLTEHTGASSAYVAMTRGRETNDVHLVAAGPAQARQQWVEAFSRGRADLGIDAARTAAERDASHYAHPSTQPSETPTAVPSAVGVDEGRLELLVEELHDAWRVFQNETRRLPGLERSLGEARADAANIAHDERTLAPLREAADSARQRAEEVEPAATAAQQVVDRQASQIVSELRPQWDADRVIATDAARVVTAGPGRFGLHRRDVTRATNYLAEWAQTWRPVIGDITSQRGGALGYASHHPNLDRIDDAIARYAADRAVALHPQHAATITAAGQARHAADTAAQTYTDTERRISERGRARHAYASFGAMAQEEPRYAAQVEQSRQRLEAAQDRFGRLTRDPLITSRPDPQGFITGLVQGWTADRDTEQAAAAAAQRRAAQQVDWYRTTDPSRHYRPSPGPDRGGPSFGR